MSTDEIIRRSIRAPERVGAAPAPTSAVRRLAGRMLAVASAEALATAPFVDPQTSGLIVTGAEACTAVRELRSQHPDLTLLVEPASIKQYASAERPFILDDTDALFPLQLTDVLDGQLTCGASVAVLPAGVIDAGDAAAAKAVVRGANAIDRDDVVLPLFLHYRWVADQDVSQLIAIARRSRHPVAIALVDSTGDPLSHPGVAAGYRRIFTEVPNAMPWRADLGAFDALAHGAFAAAIGQLPSLRRVAAPGKTSMASRPGEHYPHILVPQLARYSRSNHMQTAWFANADPYCCPCPHCQGRAIDRFNASPEQRLQGHLHNLDRVAALHNEIAGHGQDRVKTWWRSRLQQAEWEHQELRGRTGVDVDLPPVVSTWIKLG